MINTSSQWGALQAHSCRFQLHPWGVQVAGSPRVCTALLQVAQFPTFSSIGIYKLPSVTATAMASCALRASRLTIKTVISQLFSARLNSLGLFRQDPSNYEPVLQIAGLKMEYLMVNGQISVPAVNSPTHLSRGHSGCGRNACKHRAVRAWRCDSATQKLRDRSAAYWAAVQTAGFSLAVTVGLIPGNS